MRVASKGVNARLQAGFADLLSGQEGVAKVDAHSIQPYFAGLVARECGMAIAVEHGPEGFEFLRDAGRRRARGRRRRPKTSPATML